MIKELESILDARSAPIKKVSYTTNSLDHPCERNGFDKIGNLEDLQIALFLCEQESIQLNWLRKFGVTLQLKQLKYDRDVDILSRDDSIYIIKKLKIIIQEEKHCPDMGQGNEFQDDIGK